MRCVVLVIMAASLLAMSQEEQDREWAKAMEESRNTTSTRLERVAPLRGKPAAPAVELAPQQRAKAAAQGSEPEGGCGVGWLFFLFVVVGFVALVGRDRHARGPCVSSWLCSNPLRFHKPIKTPLGSRVKIVTVTLDIFFEESGGSFRITHARPAENVGSYGNILATNTGEAWTIGRGNIDRADLIEVARAELMENPGLANAMREALKRKLG